MNYQATSPLLVGRMELRDAALVRSTAGFSPQIQPESVLIESGEFNLEIIGDAPITKRGPLDGNLYRSLATHTGPITIEEGNLYLEALGPAPLDDQHAVTVQNGGRLRTSDFTIAGRKIRLDGGVIDIALRGGLAAPLEILADGGTIRNDRGETTISSTITGPGNFVVEGGLGNGQINFNADLSSFQGDLSFTGGKIRVGADLKYEGSISVTAANLTSVGGNSFGNAELEIHSEGQLAIANPLTANISLIGGALLMQFGDNLQSSILNGALSVADNSYLFITPGFDNNVNHPRIESSIKLRDGSNLTISEVAASFSSVKAGLFRQQLSIDSDISVAGVATLTSYDSFVQIAGTVTPAVSNAVLNLVGNGTFDFQASVKLADGHSLTVMEDGVTAAITISGTGKSLAGNGGFRNDVTIGDGASLSPPETLRANSLYKAISCLAADLFMNGRSRTPLVLQELTGIYWKLRGIFPSLRRTPTLGY